MDQKFLLRLTSIGLTMMLALSGMPTFAETVGTMGNNENKLATENMYSKDTYADIQKVYKEKNYQNVSGTTTEINVKDAVLPSGEPVATENVSGYEAFLWEDGIENIEMSFIAPETGLYSIEADYNIPNNSSTYAERSFQIDGEMPFQEANSIRFTKYYISASNEPIYNSLGDQVNPEQVEINKWFSSSFTDNQGGSLYPFRIYIEKGQHTLQLNYISGDMALGNLRLVAPQEIDNYAQVEKQYEEKGYKSGAQEIKFQAEEAATMKSSPAILPEYSGDPIVEPFSYKNIILNYMGGYSWRYGNSSITWEFTVDEPGLYKLSLRDYQGWNNGATSYRQIMIDGEIPFEEMSSYTFAFRRGWRKETIADADGAPYSFYLSEGKHTLTLTAKLGDSTEIISTLGDCSNLLSSLLRKIKLITGNNPDVNYDYELDTTIPDLVPTLNNIKDILGECSDKLKLLTNGVSLDASNLKAYQKKIEKLAQEPENIPKSFSEISNALSGFGNVIISLQDQPLAIDYFEFTPVDQVIIYDKSSFFDNCKATVIYFIYSFLKDYNAIGSIQNGGTGTVIKENINVWIARGREGGELVKQLADQQFTPDTGINVNMNIMPTASGAVDPLMLAINSGKAPDVCMGRGAGSPAEYAYRDAVADLTQFPGYQKVSERFLDQIMLLFKVKDGVYALPESMSFLAMYYRKDIIDELGIELPDTWDDLYNYVLPELNRNSMQFSAGPMYDVFLYQHHGQYYNSEGTMSALDTPQAYVAFKEMCELYTNYGIPLAADFFNRFRSGEMPMGISDSSFYTKLSAAAPELNGLWDFTLIPGSLENGIVDRTVGSVSGSAVIILNSSKKKEASWKFIDWWTSSSVQDEYARNIESEIGIESRWYSANVESFLALPWKSGERNVIKEELKWVRGTPIYLGSYFTGRHVGNAFNRSVISNMNIRDSLEKAVKDINTELKRKQQQYGYNDNN